MQEFSAFTKIRFEILCVSVWSRVVFLCHNPSWSISNHHGKVLVPVKSCFSSWRLLVCPKTLLATSSSHFKFKLFIWGRPTKCGVTLFNFFISDVGLEQEN
jgi:hypothetical protein